MLLLMTETQEKLFSDSFDEICAILAACSSKESVRDFLECLCTSPERLDFSKRWLSVKELYRGTPQRKIAQKFNMSLCKITRGSKELNKKESAFKKILDENFKK